MNSGLKITVSKATETPRGTGWYWLAEDKTGAQVAGGNDWFTSERHARVAAIEWAEMWERENVRLAEASEAQARAYREEARLAHNAAREMED